MFQPMFRHLRPFRLAVLAGAGLACPPAARPALAQVADAAVRPPGAAPTAPTGLRTSFGRSVASRIEAHIAHLHGTLRITAAQETVWQGFAAALRETVSRTDAAYAGRQRDHDTADAVRDLEAYGVVEETNARNVQLLLPPFRALYGSFSPDQKRTADATFRRYTDRAVRRTY